MQPFCTKHKYTCVNTYIQSSNKKQLSQQQFAPLWRLLPSWLSSVHSGMRCSFGLRASWDHHWYQPLQAFPGEVVVGALPRMPLLCFASVCSLGQCQRHLHTHHVQVSHMQLLWFALLCSLGRDHWHPQRLFWNHLTCEYSLVSSQLCQVCRSHACRCSHCHQTHPQTCVFCLFPCQLLHPSSYPGFSWFSSQAVSWVPPGFSGHPHRLSCLS